MSAKQTAFVSAILPVIIDLAGGPRDRVFGPHPVSRSGRSPAHMGHTVYAALQALRQPSLLPLLAEWIVRGWPDHLIDYAMNPPRLVALDGSHISREIRAVQQLARWYSRAIWP